MMLEDYIRRNRKLVLYFSPLLYFRREACANVSPLEKYNSGVDIPCRIRGINPMDPSFCVVWFLWLLPSCTIRRQTSGHCGKSITKDEEEAFEARFSNDEIGMYDGLSLHICARYGSYSLEFDILNRELTSVSGGLGWKIFNGVCKVRCPHIYASLAVIPPMPWNYMVSTYPLQSIMSSFFCEGVMVFISRGYSLGGKLYSSVFIPDFANI